MAKVELKKPIVEEISENIKDAQSVVLIHYSGITVEADTELRKELREAGIIYKVYKNTMMNFAFQGTDCEPLTKHLEGPNAIAISKDDATAPARILSKYMKMVPTLKVLAGIVEGGYYDEKAITALAEIPSREVLLGRLLGSMKSPISNFARVLSQIAELPDRPESAEKSEQAEEPVKAEAAEEPVKAEAEAAQEPEKAEAAEAPTEAE